VYKASANFSATFNKDDADVITHHIQGPSEMAAIGRFFGLLLIALERVGVVSQNEDGTYSLVLRIDHDVVGDRYQQGGISWLFNHNFQKPQMPVELEAALVRGSHSSYFPNYDFLSAVHSVDGDWRTETLLQDKPESVTVPLGYDSRGRIYPNHPILDFTDKRIRFALWIPVNDQRPSSL
jgi:hypothetical protein